MNYWCNRDHFTSVQVRRVRRGWGVSGVQPPPPHPLDPDIFYYFLLLYIFFFACQRGWWCTMDTPTPCMENWPKMLRPKKWRSPPPPLGAASWHACNVTPPPPPPLKKMLCTLLVQVTYSFEQLYRKRRGAQWLFADCVIETEWVYVYKEIQFMQEAAHNDNILQANAVTNVAIPHITPKWEDFYACTLIE